VHTISHFFFLALLALATFGADIEFGELLDSIHGDSEEDDDDDNDDDDMYSWVGITDLRIRAARWRECVYVLYMFFVFTVFPFATR